MKFDLQIFDLNEEELIISTNARPSNSPPLRD